MDLLNNEPKIDDGKNRKIMKIIIVIIGILVILSIALVCLIMYMQSTVLKVSIDGVQKELGENFFVFENNKIYVPIKDFAKLSGYEVYNGEYKKNEDTNKCYIESINEVAMFALGSNKIYKTEPGETNYESFSIEEPVKIIDGKLYVSSEGIKIACNVKFDYLPQSNTIRIQNLSALVASYSTGITKFGYTNISEDFSAQKAILQDLVVVQKENKKIGVINLKGEDVIGAKYKAIKFMESTKEFLVTNDENKVGILSIKGEVKIPLENDKLESLDNDLRLYIATSNNKKGVLDGNGKIILYKEYDEIGIDSTLFPSNEIENKYILFDNAIPVKKDGRYGMYDKTGKEILPLNYSGFGYVKSTTKDKSVNNLVILPECEGIILSIEYGDDKEKDKKYGIVNSLGKELFPFELEEIYSITSKGKEEYYVVYQGNELSFRVTSTTNNKEALEKEDETNTTPKNNELNNSAGNNASVDNTNSNTISEDSNNISNNTNVISKDNQNTNQTNTSSDENMDEENDNENTRTEENE